MVIVILSTFKFVIFEKFRLQFLPQGLNLQRQKIICCMFDQSFLQPFDKKCRSAIAPLVQHFCSGNVIMYLEFNL